MHGSAEALPPPARATGLVTVIAISIAIALLGAVAALTIVAPGHDRAAALPGGPFGTHQQVPMSFGAVSVDAVEKLGAVPVHGPRNAIANDVAPGQVSVRTTISVSNLLDRAIRFTPAWFRLLAGAKQRPIALAQATMAAG